jgi:hypothetical protein
MASITPDQINDIKKASKEAKIKIDKIIEWAKKTSRLDYYPDILAFQYDLNNDGQFELTIIMESAFKRAKSFTISENTIQKELTTILKKYNLVINRQLFSTGTSKSTHGSYTLDYNKIHEGKLSMKQKELEKLIENTVRTILKESSTPVYVINEYDDKTFPLLKSAINSLIDCLRNSDEFETDREQYEQIISNVNQLFNNFDGKLRKIISPVKDDYL